PAIHEKKDDALGFGWEMSKSYLCRREETGRLQRTGQTNPTETTSSLPQQIAARQRCVNGSDMHGGAVLHQKKSELIVSPSARVIRSETICSGILARRLRTVASQNSTFAMPG